MTTASDILGVLARADNRWAIRHDQLAADTGYLDHLTRAVTAHLAGKQRFRNSVLAQLVEAILLDAYDPDLDLVEQAAEAGRVIATVHTFLLGLHTQLAPHRPVEGAA